MGWTGDGFETYPPLAVESLSVFGYYATATRSLKVAKARALAHYKTQKQVEESNNGQV